MMVILDRVYRPASVRLRILSFTANPHHAQTPPNPQTPTRLQKPCLRLRASPARLRRLLLTTPSLLQVSTSASYPAASVLVLSAARTAPTASQRRPPPSSTRLRSISTPSHRSAPSGSSHSRRRRAMTPFATVVSK